MNLHRMDYQDQCYYAEMTDYSQSGLSMVTKEELVVGQLVYLEIQKLDEQATLPDKNENNTGIVRWTKPYSSANNGTNGRYKYGVEYSKVQTQDYLH
ncbi:MAG: PilZ domain-containing protein [Desulfobacteraceae bacterium]|nr:PilZ domain-containing protein [Desulfobacteraceae bacterium]